jgi:hypothetical protein
MRYTVLLHCRGKYESVVARRLPVGEIDAGQTCSPIGRRGFHALLAGTVLASLPRASHAQSFAGTKLIFAGWGWVYQNAQKAAFCEPFAEKTKATIVSALHPAKDSRPLQT